MIFELGEITSAEVGDMDRGNTFMINFRFGSKVQGFGGYALGWKNSWVERDLIREINKITGVADWKQMVGMEMYAVYEENSSRIAGIKNPKTGAVFMVQEWSDRIAVADELLGKEAFDPDG